MSFLSCFVSISSSLVSSIMSLVMTSSSSHTRPGSSSTHASLHEWSKHSSSSWSSASLSPGSSSLVFLLLLLLLLLVLGSVLQHLHPLEQSLGEDVSRLSDLDHVVARMTTRHLT